MNKFSALLGLICCSWSTLYAQQNELDAANTYFQSYLFKDAIPLYEKVLASNAEQPQALLRLAECYRLTAQLPLAASQYQRAFAQAQNRQAEALIGYAQTLKSLQRYDEAKKVLNDWLLPLEASKAKHLMTTCDYAKQKIADGNGLFGVENLQKLNTKSSDFAPTFYKDQLIFSSSRSVPIEKESGVEWTSDAVNQFYVVLKDPNTENIYNVKALRSVIHDRNINDAPMAYTRTGEWVAVTSNNFMDGIRHIPGSGMMLDLYLYETRSMSEWNRATEQFFPHNAKPNDSAPFSTGFPCFSPDGKALYFASNRPGGFGGYDLYVSFYTTSGWSKPQNLGASINTAGNELSPFVDETGRLFFASDWHPGFGGMDVFMAEPHHYGWSEVVNLGLGVNTPYDDMYFIYEPKRQIGYFSSNRPGGLGLEDIYWAKQQLPFPVRKPEIAKIGEKIVLDNEIYDLEQDMIVPPARSEQWKRLLNLLNDNPNTLVQINVHTDARGLAKSNAEWSRRCARLLAAYFVQKGVNPSRILYEGFGEEYPLNKCKDDVPCTEEEYAINRRTEIFFVGTMEADGAIIIGYNASPDPKRSTTALAALPNDLENLPSERLQPDWKDRPAPVTPKTNPTPNPFTNPSNTAKTEPKPNPNSNLATKTGDKPKTVTNPSPATNNTNPSPPTPTPPAPTPTPVRPPVAKRYTIGDRVEVATISFGLEQAGVDEKRSQNLPALVKILKDNPYWVVEIGCHTDATGSTQHNLNLSQQRANAVKNYLIQKGIDPARLLAKGYGESRVLNRCKDGVRCSAAEHAVNRRTEFTIIGLRGFKVGDLLDVDEIYYESGQDKLDLNNANGLRELVLILKNTSIRVEIGSHTDSQGSDSFNKEISEKRAKAVYEYLIQKGIPRSRISYVGYGESQILNKCKEGVSCTEEEHAVNRRTVFKVVALK